MDEFRRLGAAVVAVSMSPPEGLARYLSDRPMPIPIFADPERKLYATLGLGRTSWGRLIRPGVVWRYLRMIARGGKVRAVPTGEDALQLGGDFLVREDRQVLWAHRSASPTDRPTVENLLQVVRETIDSRPGPA
ncbi:MAG: AhpC/TSA family protein [Zavarzinella sp.]|nr:AhpC/TSA family protein [Zavarzinella sp.]